MNQVKRAIGIDFGTTNCCVGVYDKGRIDIIENEQRQTTFPCMVTFFGREIVVGEAAKDQFTSNPRNTVFDMKRLLGRGFSDGVVKIDRNCWPFKVVCGKNDKPMVEIMFNGVQRRFSAEEICAMVLHKIKTIAERHLTRKVKDTVITVPAYFNIEQRQAVKEAATIAGLHVMQLMDEPIAALVAYGLDAATYSCSTPKKILIFDLGGHSLDISLLSIKNGVIQVQVLGGDENLGGQNFDKSLVDYCAQQFELQHNQNINKVPMALLSLRMECERAKIHLSSAGETKVIVDSLYERFGFIPRISRPRFEYINAHLFKKCTEAVEKCLSKAKLKREELDHVIVAGGCTHIPKVRETIQNLFCGTEVYDGIHPEHVVAYGAAVQAAVLNAEKIDCLQLNTAPLSIGVAKQFGAMLVVVPRNTQIPFRKVVVFCTGDDNQITMSIKVYLGESSNIRENLLLGELFLCGIPPARRGEEYVAVCFAMDDTGILKVSAEHKKTGSKSELTLDKVYGFQLSKNEMERMLIDAERFSSLDKEFERNVAAREALVNQVYEMREKGRKEKLKIQVVEKEVEDTIAWLDGNDTASTCFLEQKLNDLKKKIETHFGGLSITRSACHSLPRAVSITR